MSGTVCGLPVTCPGVVAQRPTRISRNRHPSAAKRIKTRKFFPTIAKEWEIRNIVTAKQSAACPDPKRMRKRKKISNKCGWPLKEHRTIYRQIADHSIFATPTHTSTPLARLLCGGADIKAPSKTGVTLNMQSSRICTTVSQ